MTRLWSPSALAFALGIALSLAASTARADIFVYIDGVGGESADKAHARWIDASDISYGMEVPGATGGASRARAAANFEPIVLRKRIDKASPQLQQALATGRRLAKVTIEITRGARSGVYYRVVLTNVQVVGYQLSAGEKGNPTEEVKIGYEQIQVTYTPQDASGKSGKPIEFQYNVAARK